MPSPSPDWTLYGDQAKRIEQVLSASTNMFLPGFDPLFLDKTPCPGFLRMRLTPKADGVGGGRTHVRCSYCTGTYNPHPNPKCPNCGASKPERTSDGT